MIIFQRLHGSTLPMSRRSDWRRGGGSDGGVEGVMEARGVIIRGTFNCASRAARHYLGLIPVRHPDSPAAQEAGFTP